jgi:hypothetical protein
MRESRATFGRFWMGSGRSLWACPRRGRGGGRGEQRGSAPVSERGRGLAGQLHEDEVELKAGSVQAEQRWRGGATVSSSSPAFGRQWRRRSEAWEWRRKEGMHPLALRGSCSARARASTRTGRSVWGLPRQRLGGGRAAVACAWRAQETPGREGSRGGRGRRRRVGMYSSWRWSSGTVLAVGGGAEAEQRGKRG